ncbi:uncharacterized protein SCODWIG_03065 [Saccharomycodes ludwigii]|uniref:Phosphatidic acid phosphatase type 2/haloperoxidase domain-containing protein n=1 Tax=Saccharomycodes ludwigii TaxID=36035 RepID=A0A376B9U1_9ASCO|nr:uncharacterized protein SCODWIG_03065 [Saccharomycodes ludwigii]
MLVPFHIKKYCGNDINTFKFRDGLRSTPSGHSTFISCSMSFIYEYLSTTTITNNNKAIRSSHLWCIVITLLVMYSRIVDHRHHWYDVYCDIVMFL